MSIIKEIKWFDIEKEVCVHCGWVYQDPLNNIDNCLDNDYECSICPNCKKSWKYCEGVTIIGKSPKNIDLDVLKEYIHDLKNEFIDLDNNPYGNRQYDALEIITIISKFFGQETEWEEIKNTELEEPYEK